MTIVVCQPLTAPTGVRNPIIDPALTHDCVKCGRTDNEVSPTFDMSYCDWIAGWVDRECHEASSCRDPLCDPYQH